MRRTDYHHRGFEATTGLEERACHFFFRTSFFSDDCNGCISETHVTCWRTVLLILYHLFLLNINNPYLVYFRQSLDFLCNSTSDRDASIFPWMMRILGQASLTLLPENLLPLAICYAPARVAASLQAWRQPLPLPASFAVLSLISFPWFLLWTSISGMDIWTRPSMCWYCTSRCWSRLSLKDRTTSQSPPRARLNVCGEEGFRFVWWFSFVWLRFLLFRFFVSVLLSAAILCILTSPTHSSLSPHAIDRVCRERLDLAVHRPRSHSTWLTWSKLVQNQRAQKALIYYLQFQEILTHLFAISGTFE